MWFALEKLPENELLMNEDLQIYFIHVNHLYKVFRNQANGSAILEPFAVGAHLGPVD